MQKLKTASLSGAHHDLGETITSVILASAYPDQNTGFFGIQYITNIAKHVLFALEKDVPVIRIVLVAHDDTTHFATITNSLNVVVGYLRNYVSSQANERSSPLVYVANPESYIAGSGNIFKRTIGALNQNVVDYPPYPGRLDIASVGVWEIASSNYGLVEFPEGVVPSYSNASAGFGDQEAITNVNRYLEDEGIKVVLDTFVNHVNTQIAKLRFGLMTIPSEEFDPEPATKVVPADALVLENQFSLHRNKHEANIKPAKAKTSHIANAAPKAVMRGIRDTSKSAMTVTKVPVKKVAAKTKAAITNTKPANKKSNKTTK